MKDEKIITMQKDRPLFTPLQAMQGDTARYLLFKILDNGVPFNLTGKTVRAWAKKPDGTYIYNDLVVVSANDGEAELQLTSQMLAKIGILNLNLEISEGTDRLSLMPFTIVIMLSFRDDNAVESTNEFSALTAALASVDSLETNYAPRLNVVESSLSDKVTKSELQQVSLSYKESYATLALLQAAYPTGDANNHTVVENGLIYTYTTSWVSTGIQANGTGIINESITVSKIANLAVNENKTTFFTRTRNIYDPRYNVNGMLNYNTGVIQVVAGWVTSDYIPVIPGANIKSSLNGVSVNPAHIVYCDSNKLRISGTNSITSMVAPAGCYYIRISNSSGLAGINQVEIGSSPTAYIDPYILDVKYLYNSDYNNEITDRMLKVGQFVTKQGCSSVVEGAKIGSLCKLECSLIKTAYISKKNLLGMTAKTLNGVTITIEADGSFTLNGTTTTGTIFYLNNYLGYAPIGVTLYRLISYSGVASAIPEVNIGFTNDYLFSQYNLSGIQQATTVKAGALNATALYSGSGVTFTNFNMKIMVSLVVPTVFEANSTTTVIVPTSITVANSDFTITSDGSNEITTTYITDSKSYTDKEVSKVNLDVSNMASVLQVSNKGCSLLVNSAKVGSLCKLECSLIKTAYISKKNLLGMTAKTLNGVTITIEADGSFTLNGTTTTGTAFYFDNYLGYAPIGLTLYRLISYSGVASQVPQVNIGFSSSNYIFSQGALAGVQQAIITTQGKLNTSAIYSNSGVTFTNFNMKVLVSLTPPTVFEANNTTIITVPTSITVANSDFTITSDNATDITATYIADSKAYTDSEVAKLNKAIASMSDTLIQPWENKSVLFMGDSITALGGWVTQFNKVMKTASFVNVAVSGAKWIEDSVIEYDGNPVSSGNTPQNVMGNQVQKVLNHDYAAPDIIMIASGTNDYVETSTIENQFTSAGAYIPLTSVNKATLAGSIRYCVETLLIKYPLAQVFLCTPIQAVEVIRPYVTTKQKGDIISAVADRVSIPAINSRECGIYGKFEVQNANGKYLYDGLHPNAAGGILLGNYNARQVANWFSIK